MYTTQAKLPAFDRCRMEDANRLKGRGNRAYTDGHFDIADACYSEGLRVLEALPSDDRVDSTCIMLVNRAAARLKLEDYLGALEDTDAALELDSRRAKAWYRKAAALQGLLRRPAALAAAQKCLACSAGLAAQEAQQLISTLSEQAAQAANEPAGPSILARFPVTRSCLPPLLSRGPWEYIPPPDGVLENLLILMHGLGDTPAAFARLAKQMQLPQTAALALSAPLEVPFTEGGRSWYTVFDDEFELIQGRPGEQRRVASLEATLDALQRLLRMLCQQCGWPLHRVHLLGFSQGGTVALELAMRCAGAGATPLGSCVAISAALLEERLVPPHSSTYRQPWRKTSPATAPTTDSGSAAAAAEAGLPTPGAAQGTPILITHGTADAVVPRSLVERSVQFMRSVPGMGDVTLSPVPGKGHCMVQGREEMQELMQFWSRHLSRKPTGPDALSGDGDLIEVRPGEVSIQQL